MYVGFNIHCEMWRTNVFVVENLSPMCETEITLGGLG